MTTLQNIAVGYDGSDDANVAVRWALGAAHETGAFVTIAHATGLLEHLHERYSSDRIPPDVLALAEECDVEENRLRWIVENGDACSVLLRLGSPPISADVLVVGSRGHGKRPGFFLGSTSLEVVSHATMPVVVVPSPVTSE